MENDVIVLLLGANEGAYALASCFRGDYGIPVCVMDEAIPPAFCASAFVAETRTVSGLSYRGLLLRALSDFYEAHAGKSILLIPTTADYTRRVLKQEDTLARMFLLPQKKCVEYDKIDFDPIAILLLYIGRAGNIHTVYGEIAAVSETGEPLAVITKPTPKSLLSSLPTDTPHFALYLVGEDGECCPAEEKHAGFLAFPSAADRSICEWLLSDYVTCEAPEEDDDTPTGIFTLYSYRSTKKYFLAPYQTLARGLKRARLTLSLYPARGETRRPFARRHLFRFYRENWQKKTKTKK